MGVCAAYISNKMSSTTAFTACGAQNTFVVYRPVLIAHRTCCLSDMQTNAWNSFVFRRQRFRYLRARIWHWRRVSKPSATAGRASALSVDKQDAGQQGGAPKATAGTRDASEHDTRQARTDFFAAAHDKAESKPGNKRLSILGILFLFITYTIGVFAFIPLMLAHPFVLLLDGAKRRFHQFIGMSWLKLTLHLVGIHPELVNGHNLPSPGKTVVYIANHSSNMDVFLLPYLGHRLKVVTKAEIFQAPIIGWAIRMAGNIGVKRTNRKDRMDAFRQMVSTLQRGLSVMVFPEGTRSKSGRLSRFQLGAFRAAKAANVPIVPVTITGTQEIMPSHAYVPLRYPKWPVRMTVHPAIDSIGRTVEELRDLAFRAVDSALDSSLQACTLESMTEAQSLRNEASS